jgi:hypothetical protein
LRYGVFASVINADDLAQMFGGLVLSQTAAGPCWWSVQPTPARRAGARPTHVIPVYSCQSGGQFRWQLPLTGLGNKTMRWDDLTKEQQEALLALEAGSGSTLTMETVSILIDLGLVEARTGGAALSKAGRRVLRQRREDGSAD